MPITPKRVETHIEHAQPLAHRAPLQSSASLSISTTHRPSPSSAYSLLVYVERLCRTLQATLRQGRYIHVTCKPNGLPVAATSGAQDAGSSERRVAQQGNPYLPKRTGCHIRQPAPSETCYQPGLYVFHNPNQHGGLDAAWQRRRGCPTASRLQTFPG